MRRLNLWSARRIRWLLEAAFFLAASRLSLRLIPFKILSGWLGEAMAESAPAVCWADSQVSTDLPWALEAIGRRFQWSRQCLVQAMAAQWMLRRRGLTGTLYLGVRKDDANALAAHAWLRSGSDILVGGERRQEFRVVAMFGTR
jgi:hypothetical protein